MHHISLSSFWLNSPCALGLRRFQQSGNIHFVTFSCYRRGANFGTEPPCDIFEIALERTQQIYGMLVYGYVVMPEHVHLLVSEPERTDLARALQSLKQSVARTLALRAADPFWQARYYDFNVWSEDKFTEKLRYIHRNPVRRGLVEQSSSRKTGDGVASIIMLGNCPVEWRSNHRGRRRGGSRLEYFPL